MPAVTKAGTQLAEELNRAFFRLDKCPNIPAHQYGEVSLLLRRANRHTKRMENTCNYEWACTPEYDAATESLQNSMIQQALTMPGVKGIQFSGDPRGYTVRLNLVGEISNTWGEGWGIA